MEYINKVSTLYIRKFKRKLGQYNVPMPLPDYFEKMIGEKKSVRIAEVGSGPINTIGNYWLPDVKVEIIASDILQHQYEKLWKEYGATPIVPIEYQDMENMAYPDESFDIVHCVNALDHTEYAASAIGECRRICKKVGWVYFRHSPNQKSRFKGNHYWDIRYEDGKCMFYGTGVKFQLLPEFKVSLEKNLIVATWQKT